MASFTLIGVPTSAGTHDIGQEQTPMELRRAGLIDRLVAAASMSWTTETFPWRSTRPTARTVAAAGQSGLAGTG
jgi:arginase family enzyme